MLKKRIIPVLLLRNGRMAKGRQFSDYRDTGDPRAAVRIYSAQDADELVFLDIQASVETRAALVGIVRNAAEECFMPLAAGGGISSLEDIRELLLAGADKVVINTAAALDPALVERAARRFGNQCLVAGVDYRMEPGGPRVWIRCGRERLPVTPSEHARRLVELGAGEILLTCIDRDGMMQGYDLETADEMARSVPVPVIVSGGAGNFMHLAAALGRTAVSAAACASLFHFGDNNPIRARSYLRNLDIPMRVLK
jgi:imidazole glycerol-phosphate synthase subunit HisF